MCEVNEQGEGRPKCESTLSVGSRPPVRAGSHPALQGKGDQFRPRKWQAAGTGIKGAHVCFSVQVCGKRPGSFPGIVPLASGNQATGESLSRPRSAQLSGRIWNQERKGNIAVGIHPPKSEAGEPWEGGGECGTACTCLLSTKHPL